jgi:hypothetical protein
MFFQIGSKNQCLLFNLNYLINPLQLVKFEIAYDYMDK